MKATLTSALIALLYCFVIVTPSGAEFPPTAVSASQSQEEACWRPEHYRLSALRQSLQTAPAQQRLLIQAVIARELYSLGDINAAERQAPLTSQLPQIIAWERQVTQRMETAENECLRIRYRPQHQRMAHILLQIPCSRLLSLRSALDCCPHVFKPTVLLLTQEDLLPTMRGLPAGTIYSRIFIILPSFSSELQEIAFAQELVENLRVEYVGAHIAWMMTWQPPVWLHEGLRHALGGASLAFPWRVALYRQVEGGASPSLSSLDRFSPEPGKPTGEFVREEPLRGRELAVVSSQMAAEQLLENLGVQPIGTFLHRVAEVGMESAFRETFGMSLKDFEKSWQKHLQTKVEKWLKPEKSLLTDADEIPAVTAEGRQRLQQATAGFAVLHTQHFTIHTDKRIPPKVRTRIALAAEAARELISRYLPVDDVRRLVILVFRDRSDMEKLAGRGFSGDGPPSALFQGGFLLGVESQDKEEYLAEVDYRILQEFVGYTLTYRGRVPAWMVNGLRNYLFGDKMFWQASLQGTLEALQGKDLNQLPVLQSLEAFNDVQAMIKGQAPSVFAVAYIAEKYGYEALKKLVVALWNGKETEQALKEALGIGYTELDQQWRNYAEQMMKREGIE